MSSVIISSHDQKHIARIFMQEQRINAIYNKMISDVSLILKRYKDSGSKNIWIRNKEIERELDRYLGEFNKVIEQEIRSGALKSWDLSNDKNDKLVKAFIKNMSVSDIVKEGMMQRNADAFDAFINRIEDGMNLSGNVWHITKQTKVNIELYLSSGIGTGRSAERIARDIKELLYNPDARFRRIRDKNGNLVPSAPMANYNPGQGIYRSARMNAVRLAGTEINMAYRTADQERWSRLDFVLGYEVLRSQNHHVCAICDALVGKYPKEFIFQGWHPFCICYAVPVMMDNDEFADYLLSDNNSSEQTIKNIPDNARKFFNDNPKYMEKSYAGKANKDLFQK